MNKVKNGKVLYSISLIIFLFSCVIDQGDKLIDSDRYKFNSEYESIIDSIIGLMTLEEKIAMTHGDGLFVTKGVERLGIPELNYTDGPTGVREELEQYSWKPLKPDFRFGNLLSNRYCTCSNMG